MKYRFEIDGKRVMVETDDNFMGKSMKHILNNKKGVKNTIMDGAQFNVTRLLERYIEQGVATDNIRESYDYYSI